MKSTVAVAVASISFASSALAQTVDSAPFVLTLNSTSGPAGVLTTCKSGVNHNLCVGSSSDPTSANTFRHQYDNSTVDFGNGKAGTLLWPQQDGVADVQELSLAFNAINNIAVPQFYAQTPSDGPTLIGFNPEAKQNIQGYVAADMYFEGFYDWWLCQGSFGNVNVVNQTLVWTVGGGQPKGDCFKVDVIREYI